MALILQPSFPNMTGEKSHFPGCTALCSLLSERHLGVRKRLDFAGIKSIAMEMARLDNYGERLGLVLAGDK